MKTFFLAFAFIVFSAITFGQENIVDLKSGDLLTIQKNSNTPFEHLYFPKTNLIIKSGAIANYKSLDGMQVKIDEIYDDSTVKLSPVNGGRFFNKYSSVKANIYEAIKSNELKPVASTQNP